MAKRSTQVVLAHRGRPIVHTEPWEKITVVMLERHVGYLDVMSVLIRMRHHKAISRAEIIRAFVEFMECSRIDFSQFATADEMVEHLTAYFGRLPNRGRLPLLLESSLFYPERAAIERGTKDIEVVART
ncbi:MAG TPA: hypothetical protein VF215_10435 [Thermoanaerobaculia bacterium]